MKRFYYIIILCLCEKECGGSQICEHNRQRQQCIECNYVSLTAEGRICYVCNAKQTRFLICGECATGMQRSTVAKRIREERLFEMAIDQALEGSIFTRQMYVGGVSCWRNIDGTTACEEKTKAAYGDLHMLKHDGADINLSVYVELDENNGHSDREPSCEVMRQDVLKYGLQDLYPTIVIRVSTNDTEGISIEAKMRACTQYLHNLLHNPHEHLFDGEHPFAVTLIQYMFYPDNSPHMKLTKKFPSNFKVLTPIVSIDDERIELTDRTRAISINSCIQTINQKNFESELLEEALSVLKRDTGWVTCDAGRGSQHSNGYHRCRFEAYPGHHFCKKHMDNGVLYVPYEPKKMSDEELLEFRKAYRNEECSTTECQNVTIQGYSLCYRCSAIFNQTNMGKSSSSSTSTSSSSSSSSTSSSSSSSSSLSISKKKGEYLKKKVFFY